MKEKLFNFFRNLDLTRNYSDLELTQLINVLQTKKWKNGDLIIEEGQLNDSIFFLYDGEAEVLKFDAKSDDFYVINRMESGALFGEMSEITGEPVSASIRAKTNCVALILRNDSSLPDQIYMKLLHTCTRNIIQRLRLLSEKQARKFAEEVERENKRLMGEIGKRDNEIVSRTEQLQNTRKQLTKLYLQQYEIDGNKTFGEIIGASPAMRNIYELIKNLSDVDTTVLITGESGTGKGMIAIAIHEYSHRNKQAFISVNCAALSDDLLASELFGHKKGSFTGATEDRKGRFELAEEGTIFLDEIGDISPRMQTFLLRVLESGEYERVGESKTLRIDVRIITASNRDLKQKVKEGKFREDLYYRLNVMNIEAPPLRDRKADIPLLLNHFREFFNRQLNRSVESFSKETIDILLEYPWYGNVRELRNVMERSILLCHDTILTHKYLPKEFLSLDLQTPIGQVRKSEIPQNKAQSIKRTTRRNLNKEVIQQALMDAKWNVAAAARRLEISRVHLYRLLKKYNITSNNPA